MNWFMVAVGIMQYIAGFYGFYLGTTRISLMNICVDTANIILAGGKA